MPNFKDYVTYRDQQIDEGAKILKTSKKGGKKDWLDNLAKDFNKQVYQNDYEDVAYGQSFKDE